MTEILPDPYEEFLAQDPSILREPDPLQPEAPSGISYGKVALGLGAAYMAYRVYMRQQLKGSLTMEVGRRTLELAASAAYKAFVPRWVGMTAPYLLAGYLEGVRAAKAGSVPEPLLRQIAEGYAEELGRHLNEVSTEAMLSGFNAQVNRKVPAQLAGRRVTDAFGVTRRGMNTLVNVWTAEEPKKLTDLPLPSTKDQRAKYIIETQNALRARQVGETEAWTAKTQAKQIVWMYGQQHGVIPAEARRVWITAHDERVCQVCGPMDGKEAPIGEKFGTGNGQLWTPPAHVNCRCDVVLDLTPDVAMQRGITELLEAESVTKAYGQDKYDRDPRGRFAHTESRGSRRPFKEREEEVDSLLEQVNRALREIPEAPPRELKGPLTRNELAPLPPPLKGPLKAPLSGGPGGLGRQGMTRRGLERPPLQIAYGEELTRPPITREPVQTAEGVWQPLDHPLVAIVADWGDRPIDYGDTYMLTDENQDFYEVYPDDSTPDQYERSLNKAIGMHWKGVENDLLNEFWTKSDEERSYYDPQSGMAHNINEDDYLIALTETINNIPRSESEDLLLYGYGEFADHTAVVKAYDLARYMDISAEVSYYRPHLIVTRHGYPGVTGHKAGAKDDVWRNPGKWRLVGDATSERYLTHFPYQIHYAVPEDL